MEVFLREEKTQIIQLGDSVFRLRQFFLMDAAQPFLQEGVLGINEIGQQVEIHAGIKGVQFHAGDEFDSELPGEPKAFLDMGD